MEDIQNIRGVTMLHVGVISDLHCGHKKGIVPPNWQESRDQEERWGLYKHMVKQRQRIAPIDLLINNGDAIEGKGTRSGGTELITSDRLVQCEMAQQAIELWDADNYLLTYGTASHTGMDEDFEDVLAKNLGARIFGELFVELEGVPCSFKHKVGSSAAATHTRWTALMKEKSWDTVWAQEKSQHPESRVLVRSHVHYHVYGGKKGIKPWVALTTPALQGLGSKYGERICTGLVDWGITWMFFSNGELTDWDVEMITVESERDEVLRINK